jgi:hypothetical protein
MTTTTGNPIIAFYCQAGNFATPSGYTLEDILAWDDSRLETCHDYIQWLFPLKEPSQFNPDAPLLTGEVLMAFSAPELRANMRRALYRMEAFLELWDGTPFWLSGATPNNHNLLRITRIIASLATLGLYGEANTFFNRVMEVIERPANRGRVSKETLTYWQNAIAIAEQGSEN